MRILIIAHAISPHSGSEPFVGWQAVRSISRLHQITVVTRPESRQGLETAEVAWENPPKFIYHGGKITENHASISGRIRVWGNYGRWMSTLKDTLIALHRRSAFDLVHHITYASFRPASPAWHLGIPFVWGPIGGGEDFPLAFLGELSLATASYELLRLSHNTLLCRSHALKACVRNAHHIFVCNQETERMLTVLRGSSQGITQLPVTYLGDDRINALALPERNYVSEKMVCFAGGSLEGRKGIALALRAIARAVAAGVDLMFRIGGVGPEKPKLESLVKSLGLVDRVEFVGYLRGEDYFHALRRAHIYLMPSLRDSTGITLMEAMAAGCVPIVADLGGPSQLVGSDRGIKIAARAGIIGELAAALVDLHRNRARLEHLSKCAAKHARVHFTEASYSQPIEEVYQAAFSPRSREKRSDF